MSENVLDQEWNVSSLLKFAFPTIVMMIFMGLYTMVDTIFVARLVNTDALSAINIVCPVINLTVGLGTMLAAGGNAIVSRKMGEGAEQEAREDFTMLVAAGVAMGMALLAAGLFWMEEIIIFLGASGRLFPYCRDYLTVLVLFIPANILQTLFANFLVTAGRPGLGLGLSVLAGVANIIFDYLFLVPLGMGIRGAALGTGIGYLIPAAAGMVFFMGKRGTLFFVPLRREGKAPGWVQASGRMKVVTESCINGSSEMVSQLATALTTYLFNITMMGLVGEDGVAAITIMIYSQFLLNTLFLGYSMGIAPVIGFHYGNKNHARQRRVLRISAGFLAVASLAVFGFSRTGGEYIAGMFAQKASEVYKLAVHGFGIFSFGFLFCGWNIFASGMFTALSNGKISAAISFLRTFGLLAGSILLLPRVWGIVGVWLAVPAAEGVMFVVSAGCLGFFYSSIR
ncbi:MAG: MATE family efflux transporter [Lachnospiraceae bacterium]|jgi:putative MATE family efflux protein|nr:MATE family efflux transporter [Lachnospiraceae bacterium]